MPDQPESKTFTVEAARAAVQASGLLTSLEGPHFLAHDEADWRPYFIDSQAPAGHPILARVIIAREGQSPREVVISWDEYADEMENDPAWNETRERKPMTIFGSEAERHAYRVVFADVLAPLLTARPTATAAAATAETPGDVAPRDWAAEFASAETEKELDAVVKDARAARVFTPNTHGVALDRAWKARRTVLRDNGTDAWTPDDRAAEVLAVGAQIAPVVDEAIATAQATEPKHRTRSAALAADLATELVALTARADIRRPQDHRPKAKGRGRAASKRGRR